MVDEETLSSVFHNDKLSLITDKGHFNDFIYTSCEYFYSTQNCI